MNIPELINQRLRDEGAAPPVRTTPASDSSSVVIGKSGRNFYYHGEENRHSATLTRGDTQGHFHHLKPVVPPKPQNGAAFNGRGRAHGRQDFSAPPVFPAKDKKPLPPPPSQSYQTRTLPPNFMRQEVQQSLFEIKPTGTVKIRGGKLYQPKRKFPKSKKSEKKSSGSSKHDKFLWGSSGTPPEVIRVPEAPIEVIRAPEPPINRSHQTLPATETVTLETSNAVHRAPPVVKAINNSKTFSSPVSEQHNNYVIINERTKPFIQNEPQNPVVQNEPQKSVVQNEPQRPVVINGYSEPKDSRNVPLSSSIDHQKAGAITTPYLAQAEKDELAPDEKIKDRVTLTNWDPTVLLRELYQVKLMPDTEQESSYVNMEGYMEKLPTNKKKATLLKTWKRRYFKAKDGKLYYFETGNSSDKASAFFQLMGGSVEDLGARMLGIDDGRGRYMVVRCPTDKEYLDWKKSLESQTLGNIKATYMKPILSAPKHPKRNVVVLDLGSCSMRAGILGDKPCLPTLFTPTILSTDKSTGRRTFGFDAYKPSIRANSNLSHPVRPSITIDKSIDMNVIPDLFKFVFTELKVDPKQYWVMFSSPVNLNDRMKEQFLDILIKQFKVPGVSIVNQTLLALYSYNAKSGIIVDIGDRLEIVPVTDGYVVEGGVTKQQYGGRRVDDAFNKALTERKYPFFTDPEFLIVRLAKEKMCFVSENYGKDLGQWSREPNIYKDTLPLGRYDVPHDFVKDITIDLGRFKAPEGLIDPEEWEMDSPALHKLIQKAVQASPLDTRREMWRSIYLSGGATIAPGFIERLQSELAKIVPPSIIVQVHSSPQRYHAAYIGACTMASLPQFEQSCITASEWSKQGAKVLRKWHMY